MSPGAIGERLRRVAELADLRLGHRLDAKVDLSPEGIARRLREVARLRDLCRKLATLRTPAAAGPGSAAP